MPCEYSGMWNCAHVVVFQTHISACFESNLQNLCIIFCGQSGIVTYNRAPWHVLMWENEKINAAPIFDVYRINYEFWHYFRDLKIGEASVFLCSHINRWYGALLYTKIPDWLRNMGIEFTLFHILHAKPCLHRMHPKMGCVLRQHGFGWQTRNTGSSAPMLLW